MTGRYWHVTGPVFTHKTWWINFDSRGAVILTNYGPSLTHDGRLLNHDGHVINPWRTSYGSMFQFLWSAGLDNLSAKFFTVRWIWLVFVDRFAVAMVYVLLCKLILGWYWADTVMIYGLLPWYTGLILGWYCTRLILWWYLGWYWADTGLILWWYLGCCRDILCWYWAHTVYGWYWADTVMTSGLLPWYTGLILWW